MPISSIGISPTSAKGDILSSNGSSRSRVAVGTNGQILTARSSATSGMQYETSAAVSPTFELIASSVLTASAASVAFSGITSTYKYLKLYGYCSSNTTNGAQPIISFNANTAKAYYKAYYYRDGVTISHFEDSSTGGIYLLYPNGMSGSGLTFEAEIGNNPSTATAGSTIVNFRCFNMSSATIRWTTGNGAVSLDTAMTSVNLSNVGADTFGANSAFYLYGSKS